MADGRLGKGLQVQATVREPVDDPLSELPGWWCGPVVITGLQSGPQRLRLGAEGLVLAEFTPAMWALDPDGVRLLGGCTGTGVEVRLRGRTLLAIRAAALGSVAWGDEWWFPGLDRVSRDVLAPAISGHRAACPLEG